MTLEQMNLWSKARKRGRAHYVWVVWTMCWGLLTAVIWAMIMWLWKGEVKIALLVVGLIVFPIAGYITGRITWSRMERRFAETIDLKNAENTP